MSAAYNEAPRANSPTAHSILGVFIELSRLAFDNEPAVGFMFSSVFNDAKDLTDPVLFWAHTVVFGFQGETGSDGDPDNEAAILGGSPYNALMGSTSGFGFSVIYVEAIRDERWARTQMSVINDPAKQVEAQRRYYRELFGAVAHEIGHSPGRLGVAMGHSEANMMGEGETTLQSYSPASILRFRKAKSWNE